MKRTLALAWAASYLAAELLAPALTARAASPAEAVAPSVDLFDAMEQGQIEAKFIARSASNGRIILSNPTDKPVNVQIPDAFIGVPAQLAQFGGGGMGGGMGGGGNQAVGGGGGGGRGGGRGGGGRGGGFGGGGRGGGRGGFNVPPEKTVLVDVPLLCLDHGLRDPAASKPYVIRPIEDFIEQAAVIEVVRGFADGELPAAAAQAAVWHLNSGVSWDELAAKLTGTERNLVRAPYFSRDEMQAAIAIADRAHQLAAGKKVERRNFDPDKAKSSAIVEETGPSAGETSAPEVEDAAAEAEADDKLDADASPAEEATDAEADADVAVS